MEVGGGLISIDDHDRSSTNLKIHPRPGVFNSTSVNFYIYYYY